MVNDSAQWSLFVHNHEVTDVCTALTSIPKTLTPDTLSSLLSSIDCLDVCTGQPDTHYVQMISAKHGVVKSCNRDISATLDDYAFMTFNGEVFNQTVQTAKCELLVIGNGKKYK